MRAIEDNNPGKDRWKYSSTIERSILTYLIPVDSDRRLPRVKKRKLIKNKACSSRLESFCVLSEGKLTIDSFTERNTGSGSIQIYPRRLMKR